MFKAVIKNKSGRLREDIGIKAALPDNAADNPTLSNKRLDVPVIREDVLTAAVFSRLSYLQGNKLWDLLVRLFPELPARKHCKLRNIEFWPYWRDLAADIPPVEPDIFMQFEIGDPVLKVDLLIEVKRSAFWTRQTVKQHLKQISSYFNQSEFVEKGDILYFLGLGGLGSTPRWKMKSLARDVLLELENSEILPIGPEHFDGASWLDLTGVITQCRKDWKGDYDFLLTDLIEILIHAGFTKRSFFSEWTSPMPSTLPRLAFPSLT